MKKINILRVFIFLIAVIALSKFFEAGRLIANERTFAHIGMSIFSFLAFIFMLLIMGYWIYKEEKEKNNLRIKFKLYEWIYKKFPIFDFRFSNKKQIDNRQSPIDNPKSGSM